MASVSSLDQDMRNLRLSRYTPQAANEARDWIEQTLGERLPQGDLIDALKDGVSLCKLANLVLPAPGIKFKSSTMPFMQMENISHFLKACEMPPLNMPAHDRFLTVDLYESKDPAQVLQCLSAFSRQANTINPSRFRTTIGPKRAGAVSQSVTADAISTESSNPTWRARASSPTKHSVGLPSSGRALSPVLTGGSNGSQSSRGGAPVSSWSRRTDEGVSTPAWNIHQYGYMGGASQGNQGISFGAKRQITSQPPKVPSLAEKERARREKALEEDRLRQQAEEAEHKRRVEREAEEERQRAEEEDRWAEETRRLRDEEKSRIEDQKRQWAEQERRWKEEEDLRRKESAALSSSLKTSEDSQGNGILRGQSLAEYQREQAKSTHTTSEESPEQKRVRELEKQLEEARERERQYQAEREERLRQDKDRSRPSTAQADRPSSSQDNSEVSWVADEREYLRGQWNSNRDPTPSKSPFQRPITTQGSPFSRVMSKPDRPDTYAAAPPLPVREERSTPAPAPQETPASASPQTNRTDRFLSQHTAPTEERPRISSSVEAGDSSLEQQTDRDRRLASQQKTKAGGWASKSLLEREMERERERQREWEADQAASKTAPRDATQGGGAGQSWDVNQYGYMGKDVDNMNNGSSVGSGINFGGRRQIIGPRPQNKTT